MSAAIAALSGLYYAIAVLTDATYREEFLEEITVEMRETFAARGRVPRAPRYRAPMIAAVVAAAALAAPAAAPAPEPQLLVVTETRGFVHDSIPAAKAMVASLGYGPASWTAPASSPPRGCATPAPSSS